MSSQNQSTIEIARGRDDSFVAEVRGPDENNVLGPVAFDPADALDASVWLGGDEAELYSPGAVWLSAPDGTVTLTFAADDTAAIAPGQYPLEVFVTPVATSLKVRAATFWLSVVDSPGTAETSLPVYGTFQDMRDNGGGVWLDLLRRDGLANCLKERAKAREWLDGLALNAVRPLAPRSVYGAALDSGATHPDEPPPAVAALLADDALVVTKRVAELASLKALEYVCRSRLTFEAGDQWAARLRYFAAESNRLACSTRVTLADGDGNTLYALHLGVCSTR